MRPHAGRSTGTPSLSPLRIMASSCAGRQRRRTTGASTHQLEVPERLLGLLAQVARAGDQAGCPLAHLGRDAGALAGAVYGTLGGANLARDDGVAAHGHGAALAGDDKLKGAQ